MYTYVTYEASYKNGTISKVPLGACFGEITSNQWNCENLSFLIYTPTIVPGICFLSKNNLVGTQGIDFFVTTWVKVLNIFFPGHFSKLPPYQIKYEPKGSSYGQVRLHLFTMREAFNHPLIWVFLNSCFMQQTEEKIIWSEDRWWRIVGFLSMLHATHDHLPNLIWDNHSSHTTFPPSFPALRPLKDVIEKLTPVALNTFVQGAITKGGGTFFSKIPKIKEIKGSVLPVFKEIYPAFLEYEKFCDKQT